MHISPGIVVHPRTWNEQRHSMFLLCLLLCMLVLACAVRPASVRVEGLKGAGLRFSDAQLASTTGPVFDADDLPPGEVLRPAQAIKGLYAAFNARDASAVASFLTDDCVYEDLLLGPATVCRGKEAFMNALAFHPAFVSSRLLDGLPFAELLPALTLEVDSVAEGTDTVGVEWHVQCGSTPFPLGRGLSQAQTGPAASTAATPSRILVSLHLSPAPPPRLPPPLHATLPPPGPLPPPKCAPSSRARRRRCAQRPARSSAWSTSLRRRGA